MNHPGMIGIQDEPPATLGSTSQPLLDGVRSGLPQDLRQLIVLYWPLVVGHYINRNVVESLKDREEIAQLVFETVDRRIRRDGFRRSRRGAFRAWLKRITRNKVGDFIRRRRRATAAERALVEGLDLSASSRAGDDPTEPPEEAEDVVLVRQAMELVRSEVEPATFEMARLQLVERLSAAEAAAACKKPTKNAASIAKHRVMKRLREILAQHGVRVGDRRAGGKDKEARHD